MCHVSLQQLIASNHRPAIQDWMTAKIASTLLLISSLAFKAAVKAFLSRVVDWELLFLLSGWDFVQVPGSWMTHIPTQVWPGPVHQWYVLPFLSYVSLFERVLSYFHLGTLLFVVDLEESFPCCWLGPSWFFWILSMRVFRAIYWLSFCLFPQVPKSLSSEYFASAFLINSLGVFQTPELHSFFQ